MRTRCHSQDYSISFSVDGALDILHDLPPLDIELTIEKVGILLNGFVWFGLDFLPQCN